MKKSLQRISFLMTGVLFLSACSEEKVGESTELVAHDIEIEPERIKDSVPSDTLLSLEPVEEPIPPVPVPPDPRPDPSPPCPIPDPYPPKPIPLPEPLPPIKVQVDPVITFPEVEAKFPEGEEALMKFIIENINYPQIDKEVENQGRVFIEFIIEKDGTMSNIEVRRGVSPTIDQEAVRVARLIPKWTPAESRGKVIRSKMTLPITFRLD